MQLQLYETINASWCKFFNWQYRAFAASLNPKPPFDQYPGTLGVDWQIHKALRARPVGAQLSDCAAEDTHVRRCGGLGGNAVIRVGFFDPDYCPIRPVEDVHLLPRIPTKVEGILAAVLAHLGGWLLAVVALLNVRATLELAHAANAVLGVGAVVPFCAGITSENCVIGASDGLHCRAFQPLNPKYQLTV